MSLREAHPELAEFLKVEHFSPSLNRLLDCDKEHRSICQAKCCTGGIGHGRYYASEVNRLPLHLLNRLREEEGLYLVPSEGGACSQMQDCMEHPEYKPIGCWLFPLKISKTGTLYLLRYAWLHCPLAKRENITPIWKALEPELRYLFGDSFLERMRKALS